MLRTGFFNAGYRLADRLQYDAPKLFNLINRAIEQDDIFQASVMISVVASQEDMGICIPLRRGELNKFINGMSLALDNRKEYLVG